MNHRRSLILVTTLGFLIACSTTIQKNASLHVGTSETSKTSMLEIQPSKPAHEVEVTYEAATQEPCDEPVTDQDGDGRVTQGDLYMRDYDHTQRGEPICQRYDYGVEPQRLTFDFNEAALKPRTREILDKLSVFSRQARISSSKSSATLTLLAQTITTGGYLCDAHARSITI